MPLGVQGEYGAGIGGGESSNAKGITISGGDVTANGGDSAAGYRRWIWWQ